MDIPELSGQDLVVVSSGGGDVADVSSLFAAAVGVQFPWLVERVEFRESPRELHMFLVAERGVKYGCAACGGEHTAYDRVERVWKHLRFFEYPAFIHASVPRIRCVESSKVSNVVVPWARNGSGFTLLFEAFMVGLAAQMPMSKVGEMTGESGQTVFRVIEHYVNAARAKEDWSDVKKLGIDETSSSKGHHYISSTVDLEQGKVLSLTPGKDSTVIGSLLDDLEAHSGLKTNITEVSADLSKAFRKGVQDELPDVTITSDRFHVMQLVAKAQDKVRQREYTTSKSRNFKNMRFALLSNPDRQTDKQKEIIRQLKEENSDAVKAYEIRLILKDIYDLDTEKTARDSINAWIEIVQESGIPEMIKAAATIREYIEEILQYFTSKITNGIVEGINTIIQLIKRRAKGYKNINNFITMIYLKCGKLKLDLPNILPYYPR
jgi:transposase